MDKARREVWGTALATILNVVPYAMLAPQVVVHLSDAGASATAVAAFGLMPFAMILGLSTLTPRLLNRLGMQTAHIVGLSGATVALIATSLLLLGGSTHLGAYFLLASILGAATALTWTSTEALIASRTPAHRIGVMTATYQTGLGLAFAAGPFLPVVLGIDTTGMFVVSGILMGSAVVAAISTSAELAPFTCPDARSANAKPLWRSFGMILVAGFVGGVFEIGLNPIFPHMALETGLSSDAAVTLVGVVATGALVGQLPIGMLSDRLAPQFSIKICATVLLFGIGLLALSARFPGLLWPAALLLGGGGGALYTMAMIEVGRSRDKKSVGSLTSATVSAYTLGAVIGPLAAGLALDSAGRTALWAGLAILPAFVLLATLSRFTYPKQET